MGQLPEITKNGVRLVQDLFGLRAPYDLSKPGQVRPGPPDLVDQLGITDAVLVAIYFENPQGITEKGSRNPNSQAGLVVLDTREILYPTESNMMPTCTFVSGSKNYRVSVSRKVRFGSTVSIDRKDMLAHIQSLIPPSRDIILVGHGMHNELVALRALHFNFSKVKAILDTQIIAKDILPPLGSLKSVLTRFGIPFCNLHCAGNDAYFTMRLLLHMASNIGTICHRSIHREILRSIAFDSLASPRST